MCKFLFHCLFIHQTARIRFIHSGCIVNNLVFTPYCYCRILVIRGIFGHHNSFWQYIHLTASGDLKRTKPSTGALVWHLRKALCMMLYVVDDAMPQQVPPKSLWVRRLTTSSSFAPRQFKQVWLLSVWRRLYRVMYMVGNAVIRCYY